MKLITALLLIALGFTAGIFCGLFFSAHFIGDPDSFNKLYYSLPGTIVGMASLLWNVLNQTKISKVAEQNTKKDHALSAFDKYAAEPVRDALNIIDELMSKVEEAIEIRDDQQRAIAIQKLRDQEANKEIQKAYRSCCVADKFVLQSGHESSFERDMYYISDSEKLDDLFIEKLHDLSSMTHGDAFNVKMKVLREAVMNKKASMRSRLTVVETSIIEAYKI